MFDSIISVLTILSRGFSIFPEFYDDARVKILKPRFAQEWFYGLMTRPDMSIKVERKLHDMRILGRIVGVRSTEQSVRHLLTLISFELETRQT